jgi:hypothetical protein
VPTFNDAAADVPPISNLWNYTQMGFDPVTFPGGNGSGFNASLPYGARGPRRFGILHRGES